MAYLQQPEVIDKWLSAKSCAKRLSLQPGLAEVEENNDVATLRSTVGKLQQIMDVHIPQVLSQIVSMMDTGGPFGYEIADAKFVKNLWHLGKAFKAGRLASWADYNPVASNCHLSMNCFGELFCSRQVANWDNMSQAATTSLANAWSELLTMRKAVQAAESNLSMETFTKACVALHKHSSSKDLISLNDLILINRRENGDLAGKPSTPPKIRGFQGVVLQRNFSVRSSKF